MGLKREREREEENINPNVYLSNVELFVLIILFRYLARNPASQYCDSPRIVLWKRPQWLQWYFILFFFSQNYLFKFISYLQSSPLAVFFVYDYHPCSETLEGKITQPSFVPSSFSNSLILPLTPPSLPFPLFPFRYFVENVLWSFVSQLLSALRAIHTSGRACRIIHPSKIIITGKNR